MVMVTPPTPVVAPARIPLKYGLGSVVDWQDNNERWEAGVTWEGITCEPANGRGGPNCEFTDAVAQVMEVSITGGTPTSGGFQIASSDGSGILVGWNATAADVQEDIDNTYGADQVVVSGGPMPGTALVFTWVNPGVPSLQFYIPANGNALDVGEPALAITTAGMDGIPDTIGIPKEFTGEPSFQDSTPFAVYGHYLCKAMGANSLEQAQEQALEHLLAREEQRVEQAFWSGDLGNTPSLAGSSPGLILDGAEQGVVQGLSYLEYVIATTYGSQGVIHMTRGMALTALARDALEVVDGRLQTRLGTPVVAGTGYSGEGPVGQPPTTLGQSWAYATPPVLGYKSDVIETSTGPGDLLDRSNNDIFGIAEREYLLGFEGCGVVAVLLQIEPTNGAQPA